MCDGTQKVTIRGIECFCPCCSSSNIKNQFHINLKHYKITDTFIHKIEIESDANRSNSKIADDILEKYISYYVFLSFKNDYSHIESYSQRISKSSVLESSDLTNMTPEQAKKWFNFGRVFFREKIDAEKFINLLEDYDKKELEKFNKNYQTNYEYPY